MDKSPRVTREDESRARRIVRFDCALQPIRRPEELELEAVLHSLKEGANGERGRHRLIAPLRCTLTTAAPLTLAQYVVVLGGAPRHRHAPGGTILCQTDDALPDARDAGGRVMRMTDTMH